MPPLSEEERENLVAYLDGELDEESARSVEARISVDPHIRAEVDALKQAWELLEFLPRPEPSSNFTHRTLERLSVHRPISTMSMASAVKAGAWKGWVGWTAGGLAAAVAGFLLTMWFWPTSAPADSTLIDSVLLEDLRVLEHKHLYDAVEDFDFLKRLDHPDLFGDDPF